MTRLVFPDEGSRTVLRIGSNGAAVTSAAGTTVTVYTAETGGSLADIVTYPGGATITGSVLTLDSFSRLPLFSGPNDGTDTLWAQPAGGTTRSPINARVDDRIDSIAGSITVQDENATVVAVTTQLDFQGAGVTVTAGSAGEAIVTVPGGTLPASSVTYAGSTNLSSTDVESALDELDTEKADASSTSTALATKALKLTPVSKTTTYSAVDGDFIAADASGGAFTVTLPTPTAGRRVGIKKTDSSANAVTVATASGNLDGSATRTLTKQYQAQTYLADGTNWQREQVPGPGTLASSSGTADSTTFYRGDGTWATPAGGGGAGTGLMKSGQLYLSCADGSSGVVSPTLNELNLAPYFISATTLITLKVKLTANGSAGAVYRMGIYADNGSGYPGALVLDAGTVTADTGAGTVKSITISQAVTSGLYWIGGALQVAAGSATFISGKLTIQGAPIPFGQTDPSFSVQGGYAQASVTGALPSNFTTSVTNSGGGNGIPRILVGA